MSEKPAKYTISFIIPALNAERFIEGCLDSIISEMAEDDEIILVDNGSTDNTLEMAGKYEKIRILKYPDRTIAALRNYGVTMAKGNLLAFIDSDCLVCSGWRQAAMKVLANPGVHATGSHYDKTPSPSWIEKAWLPPRRTTDQKAHYIVSGNLILRREVFEAVSGFDESLITDEDTELGARINSNGYLMIDAPDVRVIHLGNPQTLKQFIGKEKWHATSIWKTMSARTIDKPMVMTFLFIITGLLFLASLPLSALWPYSPLVGLALWISSPALTAFYKTVSYGIYRHIFQMFFLFFIYYILRSITLFENLTVWFGRDSKRTDRQRN